MLISGKQKTDFSVIFNENLNISHLAIVSGYDTPSYFVCRRRMRPWSRFFYLEHGSVYYRSKSDEISVNPGDIVFLPYDIEYEAGWRDSVNGHYYSIEFIIKNQEGKLINISDDICVILNDSKSIFTSEFAELAKIWKEGTLGYRIKCQGLFLQLLHSIAMSNTSSRLNSSYKYIQEGIMFIEHNYMLDINVDDLAKMCNISSSTFRRTFHGYAGMPPIKYINMLRMKKALELLETGLYNVTETAAAVNMPDMKYFSKLFKSRYKISPGQVRK